MDLPLVRRGADLLRSENKFVSVFCAFPASPFFNIIGVQIVSSHTLHGKFYLHSKAECGT